MRDGFCCLEGFTDSSTTLSLSLTMQAGYVGEDVESILYRLLMVWFMLYHVFLVQALQLCVFLCDIKHILHNYILIVALCLGS